MGEKNDQVDRCCLCLSRRTIGAGFTSRAASSADGMITQVREACGAGMHMVNGTCVRTAAAVTPPGVRLECVQWVAVALNEMPRLAKS
jgi:hypothetical protein